MFSEYCRMIAAENILIAYRSRKASESANGWGAWGQENPELERILIDAEMIVHA